MTPIATVEKLWPNSTIVCLGSGPSLTQADVDVCRGRARVIAINRTYQLAPWADILYAADREWWDSQLGVPTFSGLKFSIISQGVQLGRPWPGVRYLLNRGHSGLELKPDGLRSGLNSGYQAVNLAVHLGATRILLLGYDMDIGPGRRRHWFGDHPKPLRNNSDYPKFRQAFEGLVIPLRALGIEVLNCSRQTALTCFPRALLNDALPAVEAMAS